MKAAEIVVRILEDEGTTAAFGIPGAAINPVYEYLKNSTILNIEAFQCVDIAAIARPVAKVT